MTRINSNVSSLVAQNTLGRSNAALEQALGRLSTGLRINTGKDDPAGLIASENLRSDITTAGTNFDNISDLKIDQANLGATGTVDVSVNVTNAATQAEVDVANIPAISGTLVAATADVTVTNVAAQSTGDVTLDTASNA